MYLIVGLGNPESDYAGTRHNMGFDTINEIAKRYQINVNKKKFQAIYEIATIENKKVILLKPQTYMNLSGDAIGEAMNFYKIEPQDVLVIYDDIDIEKGSIKVRKKGGPGSHNGMKSVVENIGTTDFPRIRVGIGQPEHKNDMINYVIGAVPEEEKEVLAKGVSKAADAVQEFLKNGIDATMNKFN